MRFPIHSLASLACFTLAGCVYNLDVEGKRCNEEHPCPPGYSCVYEGDDGAGHISGMNTGMMGTMMGGNIAAVMGDKVAADEKKILSAVVK